MVTMKPRFWRWLKDGAVSMFEDWADSWRKDHIAFWLYVFVGFFGILATTFGLAIAFSPLWFALLLLLIPWGLGFSYIIYREEVREA